jgi:predicted enzyme related to lactoylglutathione lyase
MVFHPAPEAERVIGGFVPTLQTENHGEEAKRLTGLGAKLVNENHLPPIRLTIFADPEGNRFQLATLESE